MIESDGNPKCQLSFRISIVVHKVVRTQYFQLKFGVARVDNGSVLTK